MMLRALLAFVIAAPCIGQSPQPPESKPAEPKPAEPAPAPVPAPAPATTPQVPSPATTPPAEPVKALNRVEKENGLVLEDLVIGTGAEITAESSYVAGFRGLIKATGELLDATRPDKPLLIVPKSRVIAGWREGVIGMKIGGKRRLTIPSALAYGDAGRPPRIPGKTDLIYEIEIIDALVIEDLKVGEGETLQPNGSGTAHYRGTFKDGTEFDSSVPNQPLKFSLVKSPTGVIAGWREGLVGMKVGGKRKLTIPSLFAYGTRGNGPRVPPNSDLVFEIELLSVEPPAAPVTPKPGQPIVPPTTPPPAKK